MEQLLRACLLIPYSSIEDERVWITTVGGTSIEDDEQLQPVSMAPS